MAKYLFVYHGGSMPESKTEKARLMDAWGNWMNAMGSSIVDGGSPVGNSSTVNSDGSVSGNGGSNPATGYTLIEAASLQEAHEHAKRCPILAGGGSVEVAESIDM
jgi:hypothetical protein